MNDVNYIDGTNLWYTCKDRQMTVGGAGEITQFDKELATVATKAVLYEGVKGIKDYAFGDFRSLKSISIPNTVALIEQKAFSGVGTKKDPCLLILPDEWKLSKPDEKGFWYGGYFKIEGEENIESDNTSDDIELEDNQYIDEAVVTENKGTLERKSESANSFAYPNLQLSQYINVHPMINAKDDRKQIYLSVLNFFLSNDDENTKWNQQMLKLYIDTIGFNKNLFRVAFVNNKKFMFKLDNNSLKAIKLKRQEEVLLFLDCLFILCFFDKEKGSDITRVFQLLFPSHKKEFDIVFECFYSSENEKYTRFIRRYKKLKQVYDAIMLNRIFLEDKNLKSIIVTANMSAGKSTLLNAIVGKKVNKTTNEACTGKVHYIVNKMFEDDMTYEYDHDLELDADEDILMDDNEDNDTDEIVVSTMFRTPLDVSVSVCLIDTPGVNSSENREHKLISEDVIANKKCDLMIYLLNGTQLGTKDDLRHLRFVYDHYKGKVIFLVNKVDEYRKDDDSIENSLKRVKEDLIKIGFINPEVYPISAYAAFLAKKAMFNEEMTEDEEEALEKYKRKLSKEPFMLDRYNKISIDMDENDENETLLYHSGILQIEVMIYESEDIYIEDCTNHTEINHEVNQNVKENHKENQTIEKDINSNKEQISDIFTLVDDEGVEHEFELLHELEEDGKTYYALLPTEKELQESGEDDGVYYIFEVLNRGAENQELVEVYDEDLLDKLSAKFEAYFDEMFAEKET